MLCVVVLKQLKCNMQRLLMALLILLLRKTSKLKDKFLEDKAKISDNMFF